MDQKLKRKDTSSSLKKREESKNRKSIISLIAELSFEIQGWYVIHLVSLFANFSLILPNFRVLNCYQMLKALSSVFIKDSAILFIWVNMNEFLKVCLITKLPPKLKLILLLGVEWYLKCNIVNVDVIDEKHYYWEKTDN